MYNLLKDFYISENVPAFGMRADTDQRLPYHTASQLCRSHIPEHVFQSHD